MYCISFTLGLAVTVFAFPDAVTSPWNVPPSAPPRTAWIPGREFTMGPDSGLRWSDQMPGHRVRVDISRMDDTDYTRTTVDPVRLGYSRAGWEYAARTPRGSLVASLCVIAPESKALPVGPIAKVLRGPRASAHCQCEVLKA
jgi:hypothetical protein